MIRNWPLAAILLAAAATLPGCGPAGVREQTFQNQNAKGLDRAKAILQNYVNGSPMTSEVSTFPELIEDVKKADPQKGAILEKGLADLQKNTGNLAQKAKELLRKL